MPSHDVTDAFDPSFFDTFTLHRRLETVDNHGRSTVVDTATPDLLGVVTAASPLDLQRWPEADISLETVVLVTLARIQLASPGPVDQPGTKYKADVFEWPQGSGAMYQIGYMEPYSRYGQGYLYAIAQTTNYTPTAPTPNPAA